MSKDFFAAVAVAIVICGCSGSTQDANQSPAAYSDIGQDETLVFFPTAAWLDEKSSVWHLPIHGWIYEPERSTVRKAIIAEALDRQYDLQATESTEANFSRRVELLIADNERDKRISVRIGDEYYTLLASGADGHFRGTVEISSGDAQRLAKDGFIVYSTTTDESPPRSFPGTVRLVGPEGIGVISDIDDTIKISHVTDRGELFRHTFFLDFAAVPGMSERYRAWSEKGASIHFVSSSPWQLYPPLRDFAADAGFPFATFELKSVRFRDETILNLFRKGTETKPAQIEPILKQYRKRRFVLVGDSGEQDPEVYAELMRRYPQQVVRIYIRNVTGASPGDDRFSAVFDGIAEDRWRLFSDPATLALPD